MKINFIQGENGCGKTQKIREMLGYEVTEYCNAHPDEKQFYGEEHKTKHILEMHFRGLIVRLFLTNRCKKCTEIVNVYKKMSDQEKRKKEKEEKMKNGEDKRGYKKLTDALEFNTWKFYNLLEKHGGEHDIDIWITVLQKDDLTLLFQKLNNMKIHRLFIESLYMTWLIKEIKEQYQRYFWLPHPVQYRLRFPHSIDEIYVETKTNHEDVTFTSLDIEPLSASKEYYMQLWKKLGITH